MSVSGWETECCFSVFNKFLSCYWNGFTWNMVGLVGSRVNCLRVLFLLCELPGIRVGLLIACFTWNINWSFKLSHTSKPQNPTNTSKQIISIPTPSRFTWNTKPQQPIGERQRTLNAISCNSTIRSCFTWNHSSIFRTQQTYVSRETSRSYQTSGKHNTK